MSTSDSNVVEIVEPGTELWANKWIGWWVELSSDTVWLETEDTSSDKVHIVSPSGDDWVSLDGLARNSCGGETFLEAFPSVGEGELLFFLVEPISNEGVLAITVAVSASLFLFGVSPIVVLANWALSSVET
jgi:hypothetical protein